MITISASGEDLGFSVFRSREYQLLYLLSHQSCFLLFISLFIDHIIYGIYIIYSVFASRNLYIEHFSLVSFFKAATSIASTGEE